MSERLTSEQFNKAVHEEAKSLRNKKQLDWIEGKIPIEDFWIIKKQVEMFPND